MVNFQKSCVHHKLAPARQIVVAAVTLSAPTFFIFTPRIGTKQNAARFQCCPKFPKNPRQLLAGYMKQRGVCKDAVEIFRRQIELQEILAPDVTAAVTSRQFNEAFGAVEANGFMAQFAKNFQVSPRSAAEIEDTKWTWTEKAVQQRVSILGDIMIAGSTPKTIGVLIIMRQCNYGCLLEFDITKLAAGGMTH